MHWQLADDFRSRYPQVDLRPHVLFVDDGDILTSAGSAAARVRDVLARLPLLKAASAVERHVQARNARPLVEYAPA